MITVGIVGTWKNTGKTTTLAYLLSKLINKKLRIAVTGIGYDGEEIDNITALPKPRLLFERDTVVTTSEKCLNNVDLFYKTLEKTEHNTALGNVLIIETLSPGMIVVAGPNKKSSLQSFFIQLEKYGIDVLLIDGSLNRIAPLAIVDYLIFATGASRSEDINFLAEEMASIEYIFNFSKNKSLSTPPAIIIENNNGKTILKTSSLFDNEDAKIVCNLLAKGNNILSIPKIISDEALNYLNNNVSEDIVVNLNADSPITFMLSGNPIQTANKIKEFVKKGNCINYFNKPKLQAVTVNPFYPKPIDHYFVTEYVDKSELQKKVQNKLSLNVYNIKENPVLELPFLN
ncbi:MAG: hypothetical protein V1773_13120 [bacterium]